LAIIRKSFPFLWLQGDDFAFINNFVSKAKQIYGFCVNINPNNNLYISPFSITASLNTSNSANKE